MIDHNYYEIPTHDFVRSMFVLVMRSRINFELRSLELGPSTHKILFQFRTCSEVAATIATQHHAIQNVNETIASDF